MKAPATPFSGEPRWVFGLFCLSAANLNFLPVMRELIFFDDADLYFTPLPRAVDYLALVLLVLGLAALVYATALALSRLSPRRYELGLLVVIGVLAFNPLNHLRYQLGVPLPAGLVERAALGLAVLLVAALVLRFHRLALRAAYLAAVMVSPFALAVLVQATWYAAQPPGRAAAQAPAAAPRAPAAAPAALRRVVWITFDALDRRVLFTDGTEGSRFPSFDAFRRQALFAPRVRPLGGPTLQAMPAAWLGRRVRSSRPGDAQRLEVQFREGGDYRPVAELPHLFGAAAALGARTAVVGFYHAYCRLFGTYLASCDRIAFGTTRPWQSTGVGDALVSQLSVLTPMWRRYAHLRGHHRSLAWATAAAADPRFDLVVVHAPVPHKPPIFDPVAGRPTAFRLGGDYADNVHLAERYLRSVRGAMTEAGLWRDSAVLLSSDHGLTSRATGSDVVLFMLKLPGQTAGAVFEPELDAIVLKDLVEALLAGDISTPEDAAAWLAGRR